MVAIMQCRQAETVVGEQTQPFIEGRHLVKVDQQREDAVHEAMSHRPQPLMHDLAEIETRSRHRPRPRAQSPDTAAARPGKSGTAPTVGASYDRSSHGRRMPKASAAASPEAKASS